MINDYSSDLCSLFTDPCSLLTDPCSLFTAHCSLFADYQYIKKYFLSIEKNILII